MDVTAYTFEAVMTVLVELFCTPKSSMENPSLRVKKYGSHKSRTFIVKDFIEDEFGQWTMDEATGEQRVCLAVLIIQGAKIEQKRMWKRWFKSKSILR